jgi:curved DNA-binding protein CbpA
MNLHPDKTGSDPYAKEKFQAIKEAYEVLTHPRRRNAYLQERWYEQSRGRKMSARIVTPETILQQALELERYTRTLDAHRMDRQGLTDYLLELLNSETLEKLAAFNDHAANQQIIRTMLRCTHLLNRRQETKVLDRLRQIPSGPGDENGVDEYERRSVAQHQWDRWKPWLVIAAVIVMCALIYFASKK